MRRTHLRPGRHPGGSGTYQHARGLRRPAPASEPRPCRSRQGGCNLRAKQREPRPVGHHAVRHASGTRPQSAVPVALGWSVGAWGGKLTSGWSNTSAPASLAAADEKSLSCPRRLRPKACTRTGKVPETGSPATRHTAENCAPRVTALLAARAAIADLTAAILPKLECLLRFETPEAGRLCLGLGSQVASACRSRKAHGAMRPGERREPGSGAFSSVRFAWESVCPCLGLGSVGSPGGARVEAGAGVKCKSAIRALVLPKISAEVCGEREMARRRHGDSSGRGFAAERRSRRAPSLRSGLTCGRTWLHSQHLPRSSRCLTGRQAQRSRIDK